MKYVILLLFKPWIQYRGKKSSILTEAMEPATEFYPSVTVCAGHREGSRNILEMAETLANSSFNSREIENMIG